MTSKSEDAPKRQDADRAAVMSALVTEHFVLQSAASSTISESGSRASIYLAALSSGLVAIGFSGSSPQTLAALTFTVFPTVFILGCFTVVRLIDTSIANVVAGNRIESIRRFYAELDPSAAKYFPADNTVQRGTLGVKYGRTAVLFTTASMIAVVNSVLGAAGAAVILTIGLGLPTVVAVVAGAALGLAVMSAFLVYQTKRFSPVRPHSSNAS